MFYNTLDSYGTSGSDGFLCEAELPESVDSNYTRHAIGGSHNGEKESNEQDSIGIINIIKN